MLVLVLVRDCILYSVFCNMFGGNGFIRRTQKVIQGDDNGHVWRPCEVSLAPPRNSFASYGASAVTRTSDRGHVPEVKDQCHRSEWALNQGFQRAITRTPGASRCTLEETGEGHWSAHVLLR